LYAVHDSIKPIDRSRGVSMNETTLKQVQREVDEWISQFEEGYWPPLSMLASLVEIDRFELCSDQCFNCPYV